MTFAPKKIKTLLRISRKGFYNSIDNDFILPLVEAFGIVTYSEGYKSKKKDDTTTREGES
jgi:hypothetical protein